VRRTNAPDDKREHSSRSIRLAWFRRPTYSTRYAEAERGAVIRSACGRFTRGHRPTRYRLCHRRAGQADRDRRSSSDQSSIDVSYQGWARRSKPYGRKRLVRGRLVPASRGKEVEARGNCKRSGGQRCNRSRSSLVVRWLILHRLPALEARRRLSATRRRLRRQPKPRSATIESPSTMSARRRRAAMAN
jgi:hypothetical protein